MRGARGTAMAIALALSGAVIAPRGFADAYDAAMSRAVAAREKAVDSNDPAAWQEALRLFEEADAIKATKESKYEVGNAAVRLKEDDVAVEAYESAIALGLGGKAKEKADAFVKAHASKMARVDILGPAGGNVYVGERKRGVLPRPSPIVVFAGTLKVKLVTPDGKTSEKTITAIAGETQKVDLTPKEAAPIASTSASADPVHHLSEPVPVGDPGAFARSLGWSMLVGGGLTMIAGGVTVYISGNNLSDRRADLRVHCTGKLGPDGDSCTDTPTELRADAQSDVDAIATWKGVRTAGWVAVGVGFTVGAIGAVRLLTAPKSPTQLGWTPSVDVARERLFLSLSHSF